MKAGRVETPGPLLCSRVPALVRGLRSARATSDAWELSIIRQHPRIGEVDLTVDS